MSLKALVTLFLRGLALWMFLRAMGLLVVVLTIALSPVTSPDGTAEFRSMETLVNLAAAGVFMAGGLVFFRFAPGLSRLFGAGLDAQRIEIIDAKALLAGGYAVLGLGLVALSAPSLLGRLIEWQSVTDASASDAKATFLRAAMLEDLFRIVAGAILLVFARRLSPLASPEAADAE
jgi:hypothetical protein